MLLPSTPGAALLLASVFSPAVKADDCSVDPLVLPIKVRKKHLTSHSLTFYGSSVSLLLVFWWVCCVIVEY